MDSSSLSSLQNRNLKQQDEQEVEEEAFVYSPEINYIITLDFQNETSLIYNNEKNLDLFILKIFESLKVLEGGWCSCALKSQALICKENQFNEKCTTYQNALNLAKDNFVEVSYILFDRFDMSNVAEAFPSINFTFTCHQSKKSNYKETENYKFVYEKGKCNEKYIANKEMVWTKIQTSKMDAKTQYLIKQIQKEHLSPHKISANPDEVPISAIVSNIEAWKSLSCIRTGAQTQIGKTNEWRVTARVLISQIDYLNTLDYISEIKLGRRVSPATQF